MNWENLFVYIVGSIIVIAHIAAPLMFWYFVFTAEYNGAILFFAVAQTIWSYVYLKNIFFGGDWENL